MAPDAPNGRRTAPFGDAAVLVSGLPRAQVRPFAATARDARQGGVRDVVEGLRSVLVVLDPEALTVEEATAWLETVVPAPTADPVVHTVVLPSEFTGPDIQDVCEATGIDPDELVGLLTGSELTVALVGFSPGFAYLEGLPHPLDAVPRRAVPRPVVPAGSVALAGGYAAVYPQATPGGWQIVGRTHLPLFDPFTPPFARLQAGDRVRFSAVHGASGRASPSPAPDARALWGREGRAGALRVEEPGLLSLVQDHGRERLAHLGVPRAGPADPLSHALANGLVGNAPDAPAVEVTARGPTLRALRDLLVATAGAAPSVRIDGWEVGHSHVVPLARGQQLTVGLVDAGLRTYVAASGGVLAPTVLGSRSTDVLTGLGPGRLVAGVEVEVGLPRRDQRASDHLVPGMAAAIGRARTSNPRDQRGPTSWRVRALVGPDADWLVGGFGALERRRFEVGPLSDRVGVRLDPEGPALVRRAGELESRGTVTGALQLPPDGRPIVLGPDHATLGGYPVVAVVVHADLWILGQCRPGDLLAFVGVDLADARAALVASRKLLAGAFAGRYPLGGEAG